MHTEKSTKALRTCRACIERCIKSSHRPLEWGGSSFFKVMEPNSSSRLDIPIDCVKRMQRGVCKDAILQGPSGHLWHVNLCCADTLASFTDGWESFVSDQFIDAGDTLVFRHVVDVHFSVQVFGPNGCEKHSSFSFQNYTSCCFRERNLNLSTVCNKKRCEHRQNSTTASVSLLIGMESNRNGDNEVKDLKKEQDEIALDCSEGLMNSSEINATDMMMVPMEEYHICENETSLCEENHPAIGSYTDVAPVREKTISLRRLSLTGIKSKSAKPKSSRRSPEFSLVLQKTAVTGQCRITVPKEFVTRWMSKVMGKNPFEVKLLYEKKPQKWEVLFRTYQRNCGLFSGWRAFAVDNELQEGDKCVFKLVNELEYIFKVHVIRHGFRGDCRGKHKGTNAINAHALMPHEEMKASVVNINPHRMVVHEGSIIPHSMVEYKKGSHMRGSMVGYEGHNSVEVTYIQGPTEKTKIEVIEID